MLAKCVYWELNEYASFLRVTECSVSKLSVWRVKICFIFVRVFKVMLRNCVYGELSEYASFLHVTECSVNKMCVWRVKRICFILAHYKM